MLPYIVFGLAAIVATFVIIVALRPADFRIERSAAMAASASTIFAQVNDFHSWEAWSPWAKLDPTAKSTFVGSPAGKGASFSWDGNNKVGAGTMTITESRPNDLIRINLEFRRPFKAKNTAEFTFQPDGPKTIVNWSMSGRNNFMCKAFGLFMNMDKLVGRDFEKGLAAMQAVVEKRK
jgi:hypothetical protein